MKALVFKLGNEYIGLPLCNPCERIPAPPNDGKLYGWKNGWMQIRENHVLDENDQPTATGINEGDIVHIREE